MLFRISRCSGVLSCLLLILCFCSVGHTQDDRSTEHIEGLRENVPSDYAITNVKIVVSAGTVIKEGTIVVRGGKIESVSTIENTIPADLKVIDLNGKTLYPGLIDGFTEQDVNTSELEAGAAYWNAYIRPQLSAADQFKVDSELNSKMRKQGVTARLVAPAGGILKGTSCFVLTDGSSVADSLLKSNVAQHGRLTVSRRFGGSDTRPSYPNSPMGAVALARQAMYDAQWYVEANGAVNADSTIPRPETNDALASLQAVLGGDQSLIIDTSNELFFLRADRFAREFGVKTLIHGNGFEFRRLDAIADTGRSILLPVNFPSAPNVTSFESTLNVSLETLMEWDIAPENPARVSAAGITFAFCSSGLSDPADFLKNVRIAVDRGLSPNVALKALTTTPAELLGVSHLVGTVERGKLANFVVTDGELFDSETKIVETWVNGVRHEMKPAPSYDATADWTVKTLGPGGKPLSLELSIKTSDESSSGSIQLPQLKTKKSKDKSSKNSKIKQKNASKNAGKAKRKGDGKENKTDAESPLVVKFLKIGINNARLSATFDSKEFGGDGIAQLTFVFDSGDAESANGYLTWPDGKRVAVAAKKAAKEDAEVEKNAETTKDTKAKKADDKTESNPSASESSKGKLAQVEQKNASYPVNFPLGAFGVEAAPESELVFIHNVTIWTCGEQGVIKDGAVLIQDGKIAAVGKDLKAPKIKDLTVIDGKGMHVTPGIIDCHSHIASDGGINESGQAITAEVRIGDFINANDMNVYRQLAGGVTSSNILHGSANPIGGQNQVIKLRWGMLDEEMKFAEAPQGIKFALGENVKRSRTPESTRYPRTRMGVEQIFMDEFRAAKSYEKQWKHWKATKTGLPPRRNLELDAMVEILRGDRWIHCHSYRQDEILALIRLLDGMGIQIGTFQHILEGYKVADAMKRHGAMGSAFADWWAYKFEVYDAIPYGGALMHNAGVVVSFNSDDRELARHLNHEAAKAVKYGGVPPGEALKFVTLNPAKQLRIDEYVGSIEAGKHADLVLWSGDPLSTMSRCEKTWVDGKRMFDREVDAKKRAGFAEMKRVLVQKVLASGQKMNSSPGGRAPRESEMWPNYDEYCKCKSKAAN